MANTKRQTSKWPDYSKQPGNGCVFVKDLEILEALGESGDRGMIPGGLMALGSWAYIYRRLSYLRSLNLITDSKKTKRVMLSPGGRKVYAAIKALFKIARVV